MRDIGAKCRHGVHTNCSNCALVAQLAEANEEVTNAEIDALRRERDELRRQVEKERGSKDVAYAERNRLVAYLTTQFPSYLARHPKGDAEWEDDWRWIVFVETPKERILSIASTPVS